MSDALRAETIKITSGNGGEIEAYTARPDEPAARGGVVVIHHMPGYDRATKEMVRRFAELGFDAVCPNLYWREAPGAEASDAAAAVRAKGGVPDDQVIADVAGAVTYLRALDSSNGRVGVIGHCSGGRQAVLTACHLDLQAAVDCYGAFVIGNPPESRGMQAKGLESVLPQLRAPLLGLFGNDDQYPSPEDVGTLEKILIENDRPYEFHRYDDAAHAFFAVDRPSYRVEAANDGWERIAAFYAAHLGG